MIIGKNIHALFSKKNYKLNVIFAAAKLFKLDENEREYLANKAGLSCYKDKNFPKYFNTFLQHSKKKYKNIYNNAQISERMFRHFKKNYIPPKLSLLALAISLGLSNEGIYNLLNKAGYVLSKSIAIDMVIKSLIENDERNRKEENIIMYINEILYKLDLPLLMTREK